MLEQEKLMSTKVVIVGDGTMGARMGAALGVEALGRSSENYGELVTRAEVIILATKQKDGLDWLINYGSKLKTDQTVVSLVGFIGFDLLELAVGDHQCHIARMMTDTGLSRMVWTDDGGFSQDQVHKVDQVLGIMGQKIDHVGSRNDTAIEAETLLACELGWLAAMLVSEKINLEAEGHTEERAEEILDQQLATILQQRQEGLSYEEIFEKVATDRGVTRAGTDATLGVLMYVIKQRMEAALKRREEIQTECRQYVVNKKKGLAAEAN